MASSDWWKISLMVLAVAVPVSATADGPGESAGAPRAGPAVQGRQDHADFRILVWYRKADPLGTFQYQVYDVRKGEYTAAVDAWIHATRTKYPAYVVLLQAVHLRREAGATEPLKVGSVIQRELMVAAARSGIVLGEPLRLRPGPLAPAAGPGPVPRQSRPSTAVTSDRTDLNPTAVPFPVPIPYPRPHP